MSISQLYPESRPSITANFARTKRIPPEFQYSRASTGTYVGSDGLINTALVGEPRFDHNPTTGESLGLLVEESRINYQVTNIPTLVTDGIILSTTEIAPDGSSTAILLNVNSTGGEAIQWSGGSRAQTGAVITGEYFTVSYWLKGNNGDQWIFSPKRDGGGVWAFSITYTVTSSWVRYIQTFQIPFAGATAIILRILGPASGNIYIWGLQVERGPYPTSYIPTSGLTVTRAADTLSPIILPNSNSSTILVETESIANNTPILSLNDGTTTNEIRLLSHPLAGGSSVVEDGEAITTSVGGSRLYKTTNAISVSSTTANIVSDNGVSGSTTIFSTNLNQLRIGSTVSGTIFNGTIKKLYYYNTASSIEKLKGLSKTRETTPLPPANEPNLTMGVSITSPNTTWNLRSTGTVSYDVDWGDGQIETAQTSNTIAHTYVFPGIYKVVVKIRSGVFRPFYNNNADAERIVSIFGTGTGWSFGTSLNAAWYRGVNIVSVDEGLNTSTIIDFINAWTNCRSLLNFPLINTAAGTNFGSAWFGCSSLTSFPLINTAAGTNFGSAWFGCSSLTSFPLLNTSSGTNFLRAWQACSGLTSFPLINTSAGTNFQEAWQGCSSLINFPLINTSNVTNFASTWGGCTGLTSFPLINTSNGTLFNGAWINCSSLTSFPLIDTSKNTNFQQTWAFCSSLTSFPLLDTSSGTNFLRAWQACSGLTSFPLINTSVGTNFQQTWENCNSLTSFPLIDTSSGTNFGGAWGGCTGLTSFPLINTSNGTDFSSCWRGCSSLTSFPLLDTSKNTNFSFSWWVCSSLTSFPLLDTSKGTNFFRAWRDCISLTSFPALNFNAAVGLATAPSVGFDSAWLNCTQLANFPPDLFVNTIATNYLNAFFNCALTAQSIENILVSINTANTSNGTLTLSGGTNATKTTWTTAANTAYDTLISRGWTITFNP